LSNFVSTGGSRVTDKYGNILTIVLGCKFLNSTREQFWSRCC
jgi:hypothetical protein